MNPSPTSMLGFEFFELAESDAEIWSLAEGSLIQHKKYGSGDILRIQVRKGCTPYLTVNFSSTSKPKILNADEFRHGKISKIHVSETLASAIAALKDRLKSAEIAQTVSDVNEIERHRLAAFIAKLEIRAPFESNRDLATRIQMPPFDSKQYVLSGQEYRAHYVEAKRAHYANALPLRVTWLREWASRIQRGEEGLDPAWSLGQSAADYLRSQGIFHLWHFTDVRNLKRIRQEWGLVSWAGIPALGIADAHMVADDLSRTCDELFDREHFVRLSFIPNSLFFHRVRHRTRLVWMRFSLKALSLGEVFYSHGNAASGNAVIQDDLCALGIDWAAVRSFSDVHSDKKGPTQYPKKFPNQAPDVKTFQIEKDSWNSEVLVKHFLPWRFCTGVFNSRTGAPLINEQP
jgi:hypothetical protein